MSKPRPASSPQLHGLNKAGALQLVAPRTSEPLMFDTAWQALADAAEQGAWHPKQRKKEPTNGAAEESPKKEQCLGLTGSDRCSSRPVKGWDFCPSHHAEEALRTFYTWRAELQEPGTERITLTVQVPAPRKPLDQLTAEERAGLAHLLIAQNDVRPANPRPPSRRTRQRITDYLQERGWRNDYLITHILRLHNTRPTQQYEPPDA